MLCCHLITIYFFLVLIFICIIFFSFPPCLFNLLYLICQEKYINISSMICFLRLFPVAVQAQFWIDHANAQQFITQTIIMRIVTGGAFNLTAIKFKFVWRSGPVAVRAVCRALVAVLYRDRVVIRQICPDIGRIWWLDKYSSCPAAIGVYCNSPVVAGEAQQGTCSRGTDRLF